MFLRGGFASGFSMAADGEGFARPPPISPKLDVDATGAHDAAAFWQNASAALGKAADHTEIYKFLAAARGRT